MPRHLSVLDPIVIAGVFSTVTDLKALATTSGNDYPSLTRAYTDTEGEYYLDRSSTAVESLPNIVAPNIGSGRWRKINSTLTDNNLLKILTKFAVGVQYTKTLFVSPSGNNESAVPGSPLKVFKTIKAAVNAASTGDLIVVFPGVYDEYDLAKNGLTYYFYPGAKVQPTFNGGKIAIFTDLSLGSALSIDINGYGEFICNGRSSDDTSAFVASYNGSVFNIQAKTISSIESWNQVGAVINVRDAAITVEAHCYTGGKVTFENCIFRDVVIPGVFWGNNCTFVARKCKFIRTAINSVYSTAYPGYNQTTRSPYTLGYHLSGITSPPFTNIVMELIDCDIVNGFPGGADCLIVPNYNYSGTSYLMVLNCRFYNLDPTKSSILYTDNYLGMISTPSDDANNTQFYLNNNISNVNISSVDTDSDGGVLINQLPTSGMMVVPNFKIQY